MGHVVVHRDHHGAWALEEHTSLDDALAHVEQLRNVDGADEVRLFEEVPLEVRTYYRVAVAGRAEGATPAPTSHGPGTGDATEVDAARRDAPPVAAAATAEPSDAPAAPVVAAESLPGPDDAVPASPAAPDPATAPLAVAPSVPDRLVDTDLTALLSPFEAEDRAAASVGDHRPPTPLTPPPGTFPLGGTPVPAAAGEDDGEDDDAAGDTTSLSGRRASRFGRDR